MTQVGIRELKAKLSEYVRKAKKGQAVEITEHGKTVARLAAVPVYPNADGTGWSVVREATPGYQATGPATIGKPRGKGSRGKVGVPGHSESAPSYAELLQTAQKEGGHRTSRETLTEALSEYVRRRRRMRIAEAFGQIEYDPGYDYKKQRRRK